MLLRSCCYSNELLYLMIKIIAAENPANLIPNDTIIIPFKNQDGVFSNLNAKPEVMKIELTGQYMDKPPSYSQAALNMPPTYQDTLDDFDVISGMLVGNKGINKLSNNINIF